MGEFEWGKGPGPAAGWDIVQAREGAGFHPRPTLEGGSDNGHARVDMLEQWSGQHAHDQGSVGKAEVLAHPLEIGELKWGGGSLCHVHPPAHVQGHPLTHTHTHTNAHARTRTHARTYLLLQRRLVAVTFLLANGIETTEGCNN